MSNFSAGEDGTTTYMEPRGADHYRAEVVLDSEFKDDHVGLCVTVYGDGSQVAFGIGGSDDVQEFLYAAAVQAKLIADGEPLILMKKVTVDAEDAA